MARRKRAFLRLLNFGKHLTDDGCCHPVQGDLRHVLTSPRAEGGIATFPGVSNYHALNDAEETKRWFRKLSLKLYEFTRGFIDTNFDTTITATGSNSNSQITCRSRIRFDERQTILHKIERNVIILSRTRSRLNKIITIIVYFRIYLVAMIRRPSAKVSV